MRKDSALLASMRLSNLLTRKLKTKPVPPSISALAENDTPLHTAFRQALRQLDVISERDTLLPWLETTGLALLHDPEKLAFALEEIAQRSLGQSCHPAIRHALLTIALDRDPQTGQPDQSAHFPASVRDAAACSLDQLGYLPVDLSTFVPIPQDDAPGFYLARYPVTNAQYARFLTSANFAERSLWCDFPKFSGPDEDGSLAQIGTWADEGWRHLQAALADPDYAQVVENGVFLPRSWVVPKLGPPRQHVPVVGISWFEANAYCKWLQTHWDELDEGRQGLARPGLIRLPTGPEWLLAAGGAENGRLAWGELLDEADLTRHANIGLGRTTPVWMYPQGASLPHGLMDMTGNVREWQANFRTFWSSGLTLQAGSWTGLQEAMPDPFDDEDDDDSLDLFAGAYDLGFRPAAFLL